VDNKTYNIFVLEDNPERIKWFKTTFGDCNLLFTDDVEIACAELRTKYFDLIFIDRDLGYSQKSGEDVVRVMEEEQLAKDSCIVIHTVNPYGQKAMKRCLESYHDNFYCIDFTQLVSRKPISFKSRMN
jgi:CheY-like chemotaxis protein